MTRVVLEVPWDASSAVPHPNHWPWEQVCGQTYEVIEPEMVTLDMLEVMIRGGLLDDKLSTIQQFIHKRNTVLFQNRLTEMKPGDKGTMYWHDKSVFPVQYLNDKEVVITEILSDDRVRVALTHNVRRYPKGSSFRIPRKYISRITEVAPDPEE